MKELDYYIINNFDDKDINHAYSILIRFQYELEQMSKQNRKCDFILNQMNSFIIEYHSTVTIIVNHNFFQLTEDDINQYVDKIYHYFNKKYRCNYDLRRIDPIYFSLFFYDLLDKITYIKEDSINIGDILLLRYKSNPVKMEESERYKALVDNNYKMYSPFPSNLIIETPEERLNRIKKMVMDLIINMQSFIMMSLILEMVNIEWLF